MNIAEFFQKREGLWISQRTNHDLTNKQAKSTRSEIFVELFPNDGTEVQQLAIPQEITCCLRVTRENRSSILIAVADGDSLQQGALWRITTTDREPVLGRFSISEDAILTMTVENAPLREEKLWFALPNLCMRTGVTIGDTAQASFWTEIRKVR